MHPGWLELVYRLKKNTVVRTLETFSIPVESAIQRIAVVMIGTPQNRMENVLRLIKTVDSEGSMVFYISKRYVR